MLAFFADTPIFLMLTSSMVNSVVTAWMAVSVWKIVRPHGKRIAGLIAFSFAAISLGYTIRLSVLSLRPTEAVASGLTIVIVTLMAWAAIILQIGAVALRERRASHRAAVALKRVEEAAEARERFLLGLSHEIRTPLNGLLGIAELLRIEALGPVSELYHALIDELRNCGFRLNQLLMDLLEIASPDGADVKQDHALGDTRELVDTVIESAPDVACKGDVILSSIEDFGADNPPCVYGDAGRLHRLRSLLVENSLKFAKSKILVSLRLDNGMVTIAVEDDGPGMTPSQAEAALKMFDRGGGGGEPESGAGLGLTVASRIAAAHGGQLSLGKSPRLGGLRDMFALPEVDRAAEDVLQAT